MQLNLVGFMKMDSLAPLPQEESGVSSLEIYFEFQMLNLAFWNVSISLLQKIIVVLAVFYLGHVKNFIM